MNCRLKRCKRTKLESKSQPLLKEKTKDEDVKELNLKANHNTRGCVFELFVDVKELNLKANHNVAPLTSAS